MNGTLKTLELHSAQSNIYVRAILNMEWHSSIPIRSIPVDWSPAILFKSLVRFLSVAYALLILKQQKKVNEELRTVLHLR